MELSQNGDGDAVMYLTGVPIEGVEQHHDDNVQYVEIICEDGQEVSFVGDGSGIGYLGETVVLEDSVLHDSGVLTSEGHVVTTAAAVISDASVCTVPVRNNGSRNSRSLLRINNMDVNVSRGKTDVVSSDEVPSNLVIDENCKMIGGEGGELIVEIAMDSAKMTNQMEEDVGSSVENLHTTSPENAPTVYHAVVTESGELSEPFVVPQQDLSALCSMGFQSDAGEVTGSTQPQVTRVDTSLLSTPGLNTPVAQLETPEGGKFIDSPFASFLRALPDFAFTADGASEQKLVTPPKPVSATPSELQQSETPDDVPLSLYTLIPNVDAATADNLCVNVSPAIADTLNQTLAENKSSHLLPVLKLKASESSSGATPAKPKAGKPGPIFKICRVVRRPNGTVTCMQTDMRNISLGDRQAVYRTMLEKFPDIVHSKVNSVLNSQRKKRRPRQSVSKTSAPPVNPQMAVTSYEIVSTEGEDVVQEEMCVDDDSSVVLDECDPALAQPIHQDDSAQLAESTTSEIETDAAVVQMAASEQPILLSVQTASTRQVDSSLNSAVESRSPLKTSSENCVVLPHATPTPADTSSGSVKAKSVLSNTPKRLVTKGKVPIVKTVKINLPVRPSVTVHVCKSETTVTCKSCEAVFKSIVEFQSHALLSYVKAVPHIYDPNAVLMCALCQDQSESFSLMSTIQEHFVIDHSVVFTTDCDECKKVSITETKAACDETTEDVQSDIKPGGEVVQAGPAAENSCSPEKVNPCPKTMADVIRIVKGLEKHVFKCRFCDDEFDQRQAWRTHVRAHQGQQLMPCPLCGMSFHRKNSLSLHMRVHVSVKPKKEKNDYLDDEKKRQKGQQNKENGNEFAEEDSVSPKIKEDGGPILCELCGKELKNVRQLNQHQRRRHQLPCKRPIKVDLTPKACDKCGKVYNGTTALKNHQRNSCGLKEVLCEICGKVFPFGRRALSNHKYQVHKWRGSEMEKRAKERERARLELQGHVKEEVIDPSEEPYTSPKARRFRQRRLPRKEFKPQVCELCGFVAKYATSLRCHLVNKHKYPKKRSRINFNCAPTACDKCGLVCKGPAGVKLHQNRFCGRDQGNLSCPTCGKVCTNRKNLSRHKYGHKWFGTEKEKAWKEKRKMLGLPLRGAGGKKQILSYSSHIAAEVIVNSTDGEIAGNMITEPMTEEQEDLQRVANAIIKQEDTIEMPTHVTFTGDDESVLDPTSQLLQAIANDPQFAGQNIQITTESSIDVADSNALEGRSPKVTTYRIVRLINHLGEPMLAYLPDVQEGT